MLTMFDFPSTSEDADAKSRDFIRQTMGLAAIHANIAAQCAEAGDNSGLRLALRCFASSKAALQTFADLKAANIKGAVDGRE